MNSESDIIFLLPLFKPYTMITVFGECKALAKRTVSGGWLAEDILVFKTVQLFTNCRNRKRHPHTCLGLG